MLGPLLVFITGVIFLFASPPFGILLIVASMAILPFSRKLDADVEETTAALAAAGVEPDLGTQAQGCGTVAIGAFGIFLIICVALAVGGYQP